MQGRFGLLGAPADPRTRRRPTASPAPGPAGSPTATPSTSRSARPELDDVVRGFLLLRDAGRQRSRRHARRTAPTSTASRPSTRASTAAWARAATTSATTGSSPPRRSTRRGVRQRGQCALRGHRRLDRRDSLPEFSGRGLPAGLRRDFQPPAVEAFDGTAPDCGTWAPRTATSATASPTTTPSYFDETDLAGPAYDEIGDFAIATAISLPYALAARDQAGAVDRRRRRHPVGRLPDRLVRGPVVQRRVHRARPAPRSAPATSTRPCISCSSTASTRRSSPTVDASGFELVGEFRTGFLQGGGACNIGV